MKLHRKTILNTLTYLLFIFTNLTFVLKITHNSTLPGIIGICCIPFLMLNLRRIPTWILLFIFFEFIILPYNSYGVSNIIFYTLVCVGLYEINIRTILKANLLSTFILFIAIFITSKLGLTTDYVITKASGEAHDFGFGNSNTFAEFIIYTLITIYLLHFDKKILLLIIITISTAVFFYITQSRSLILVSLLLCISLLCNSKYLDKIITSKLLNILLIGLIPISVLLLLFSSFNESIDEFTSKRSIYMAVMLNEITGNCIFTGLEPPEEVIIDNVYMLSFVFGGIITLILLIARDYITLTSKRYEYKYNVVIFIIFIWGFVESCYLNPFISGTYIAWILLIGNRSLINKQSHFNATENISTFRTLQS